MARGDHRADRPDGIQSGVEMENDPEQRGADEHIEREMNAHEVDLQETLAELHAFKAWYHAHRLLQSVGLFVTLAQ